LYYKKQTFLIFWFHILPRIAATELVNKRLQERELMQIAGWKTNILSSYKHMDGIEASQKAFKIL